MSNNQNNPLRDICVLQSEKPQDVHDMNVRNMENKPQEVPQVKSVIKTVEDFYNDFECSKKNEIIEAMEAYSNCMLQRYINLNIEKYQSRIAELEKQNAELKNIIEFDLNHGFEMEAENKRLNGILERVRSMSSIVSLENNRKIRFFITEALNSNNK